jgi:hypothetical protein
MVLSLTTSKGVQDFAVNKGAGAPDREDHQGNGRPAQKTEDELTALRK